MAISRIETNSIAPSQTLTTPIVATTMGVGGATPAASGSGITFPATQSASTDANTLDDYEEGTFTPSIILASGSPTYGLRVGRYIKVGKVVHFWVDVVWTSTAAIGLNYLAGLPYATQNTAYYPTVSVGNFYFIDLGTGGTALGAYVVPADTQLRFHSCGNNTNQLGPATTSSSMEVRMAGSYETST